MILVCSGCQRRFDTSNPEPGELECVCGSCHARLLEQGLVDEDDWPLVAAKLAMGMKGGCEP